ncbi:MAG: aminodeoxychorismate synthase component I [Lewinella sp.]|nr:aminodeoxychorismate synthase component I [Lewinella sp.]
MGSATLPIVREQMNAWGAAGVPFLLLLDFEQAQPQLWPLADIDPAVLRYDFHGLSNSPLATGPRQAPVSMVSHPLAYEDYLTAFQRVQRGLHRGDSFLVNLTFPTPVELTGTLAQVYAQTQARYRLWWRDEWVVFSPEIFVQIKAGRIYSYPMKGTLPAQWSPDLLIDNPKEKAEHATIVDLIRNDLSQVARRVQVERYRYLERLTTQRSDLWQTSSRIAGQLPDDCASRLGNILLTLLPAGSISGAPKASTLRIIQEAEGQPRGYYTGIAALWDGQQLDSCVLIRCIERSPTGHRYWSGGGITARSIPEEEYQELKEKVYLPIRTEAYSLSAT